MPLPSSDPPDLLSALGTEAAELHRARRSQLHATAQRDRRRRQVRLRIAQLEEELAVLEAEAAVASQGLPAREEEARGALARRLLPMLDVERARPVESGRTAVVGIGRDPDGVLSARALLPIQPPSRRRPRPVDPAERALAELAVHAFRDLARALELVGVRPAVTEEFGCFTVELRLGREVSAARTERAFQRAWTARRAGAPPLRLAWLAWWLYEEEDMDEDYSDEDLADDDFLDDAVFSQTGFVGAGSANRAGVPEVSADPEDEATSLHPVPVGL